MKRAMEKISILSLSLLLVSTYSVSAALPAMQRFFKERSVAEVEQLISITSFAIMIMILLDEQISRCIKERMRITIGILLIAAGGCMPMVQQQYTAVLAARILLGIGIGLINTCAIHLINERYQEDERSSLLGFRSSAEVLGNAVLTIAAGRLLQYGWTYAFLIYVAALPVLLLYLLFVPERRAEGAVMGKKTDEATCTKEERRSMIREHAGFLVGMCVLGVILICINCANTMRIPTLVLERKLGTEADASVVLGGMMAAGILAGACYGRLTRLIRERVFAAGLLFFGIGMVMIAASHHMTVLAAGAMLSGMAYSIAVTELFRRVSLYLPAPLTKLGTTCILAGCNLGGTITPFVLGILRCFGEQASLPFWAGSMVMLILGTAVFLKNE